MKRLLGVGLSVALLSGAGSAGASPITINDNYIGADGAATSSSDVIGALAAFDLSQIVVEVVGGNLQVDVYGRYFDDFASNGSGLVGTKLGDLFVSSDGWAPFGSAPYGSDNATNSSSWEFAVVSDTHDGGSSSGTAKLFAVNNPQIVTSIPVGGGNIRDDQEVQYDPKSQAALAIGTWAINGLGTATDLDDFLRYTIAFAPIGSSDLGIRWQMSCANDVIEGAAVVPEPTTMALLGVGLLGIGLSRRMRRRR